MKDVWLSGRPKPVGVSDLVVKSAADGVPVRVTRVVVVRSDDGRSVLALTPGELPALERALAADPEVRHWTVSEQEFKFDEGGEA